MSMESKKASNVKKAVAYSSGSAVIFAATTYTITKYGSTITGAINKYMSN